MTQNPTEPRAAALPSIGFGTYAMEGDACRAAIASALDVGYRVFDSAEAYGNEVEAGEALAASGVARDELFVISKFWFDKNSPEGLRRALDGSLARTGLDWFDLYMLHWPSEGMDLPAILKALRVEKDAGRVRRIGVCNFPVNPLRRLLDAADGLIEAVELEWHPFLDQRRAYELLSSHGVQFIAYCPLAQGRVAAEPALVEIGRRHGVPASTIALAWLISNRGVTAIPKAVHRDHQLANFAAGQVRLTEEDLRIIAALPKDGRLANFPFSPDWDAP